ncbi:MAG: TrkH family potassium uptake protein [Rhizobiales bacterium]|nr:TrkH family potassium uptake protein [Hyphomicrobiales bacterium]
MNKNGSLYYLGVGIVIVGFMQILLIIFAMLMRDQTSIISFFGASILSLFCGATLILATRGNFDQLGRLDSILLLVYFWAIIPIFAAIPFYSYLGSFASSYIEVISALTTTGASVIETNRYIPNSLFLWRNILAWSGGLLTITMVILILAPLGIGGLQDRSSKFLGSKYNENNNFMPVITMVGGVYSAITFILIVALMLVGARGLDATNIIMSTISTSGYNVNRIGFGYYDSIYSVIIIAFSMLVGAGLIIVFFRPFINVKVRLNFNIELKLFVIICVLFALMLSLYSHFNKQTDLITSSGYYFYALFDAVSILSTTGLIYNTDWQPINFYYVLAFIGGASFTTAGGMKLFRLIILLKHAKIEVNQLIYPSSVSSNRFLDMRLDTKFMRLIWSFFIAYMFLIVVLSVIVASYNYNLNTSLLNAIGAVANIGPMADFMLAKGQDVTPFNELETSLQLILCVGMILGRLEVLSVLGLLNLAYWKNR